MRKYLLMGAMVLTSGCASSGQSFFGTTEVTAQARQDKVDIHTMLDPLGRRNAILEMGYLRERSRLTPGSTQPDFTKTSGIFDPQHFFATFDNALGDSEFREIAATDAAFVAFYTYGVQNPAPLSKLDKQNYEKYRTARTDGGVKNRISEVDLRYIAALADPVEIRNVMTSDYLAQHRNAIQDRIISASNEQCQAYKQRLVKNASNWSFVSDAATIALAGMGAIFTDPSTVRALAGAAGITAGWGDAFRSRYLQERTSHIISEGIDLARADILREINRKRFGEASQVQQGYLAANSFYWQGFDLDKSTMRLEKEVADAREKEEAETTHLMDHMRAEQTAREAVESTMAEIADSQARLAALTDSGDEDALSAEQATLNGLSETLTAQNQQFEEAMKRRKDQESVIESLKEMVAEAEAALAESQLSRRTSTVKLAPIYQYSVEAAIADAINYHAKCSLAEGLAAAEQSVAEAKSPSLDGASKILENVNKFQEELRKLTTDEPSTEN